MQHPNTMQATTGKRRTHVLWSPWPGHWEGLCRWSYSIHATTEEANRPAIVTCGHCIRLQSAR